MGTDDVVDPCSGAYGLGKGLGVVHQVLTAIATGGASAELEEGGLLAGEAAEAAEGAEAGECPSCRYEDTTTGNSIPNRTTDVTRSEFEQNPRDSGFKETVSKDGKVSIFDNGAGQRYTLRDYSNQGSPTAEFFSNGTRMVKIRLQP